MRQLLLVLVAGLLVAAQEKDDPKKELDKFTGTWVVVSVEQGGQKLPDDMLKPLDLKLVIMGDKYESKSAGMTLDKGTLVVDGAKTPKIVDITPMDGPNKGKKIPAIYEFSGEELKACYDIGGKERPKEFATKPGTELVLVIYKKQK